MIWAVRTHIVDKSNNRLLKYCTFIISSIILFVSYVGNIKAVELSILGNVSKGTCSASLNDMKIVFEKPLFIPNIKENVEDKTYVKPFSLKYKCSDFDFSSSTGNYLMKIVPGNGTLVDENNKIYPTSNVTNAAFVLRSCDSNKSNCKIVNLRNGGELPFDVIVNGDLEHHFEVSVVQLGATSLKSGELVVAVDVNFLQP